MEFSPSKRQNNVLKRVQKFIHSHVDDNADRWDKTGRFPLEAWRALSKAGLTGLPIPRKYGGAGEDVLSYILAVEEISKRSAALGVTLAVHVSLVSQPLLWFGTEKQKTRYLKPLAQGRQFGSFCLTEPGAGSDVAAMESKATQKEDEFVIRWKKILHRQRTNGRHISGLCND